MPDDLTRTITLSTPVTAYGETVTAVTVRRPTAKELRQCGQPYVVATSGGVGIKADYNACAALLTYVCDPPLPSGSIDALDAADFDDLSMILVGFTTRSPWGERGWIAAENLIDNACDVAWFWRMNPLDVMALSPSDIRLLDAQARRIIAARKQE